MTDGVCGGRGGQGNGGDGGENRGKNEGGGGGVSFAFSKKPAEEKWSFRCGSTSFSCEIFVRGRRTDPDPSFCVFLSLGVDLSERKGFISNLGKNACEGSEARFGRFLRQFIV